MSDDIEKRARAYLASIATPPLDTNTAWTCHYDDVSGFDELVTFARAEATRARIEELESVVRLKPPARLMGTLRRRIHDLRSDLDRALPPEPTSKPQE